MTQRLRHGGISRSLLLVGSTEGLKGVVLLATTAHIARIAGSATFGVIGFAQGLLTYFTFFGQFGLDMLGARVVARDDDGSGQVGRILVLRGVTCLLAFVAMLGVAALIDAPSNTKLALVHFSLSVAATPFLVDWYFYGRQQLGAQFLIKSTMQIVLLGTVFLCVREASEVLRYPVFFTLSIVVGAVLSFGLLLRQRRRAPIQWTFEGSGRILGASIPLGASLLLQQVLISFGIIALGFLSTPKEVGLFTAAQKLTYGVFYQGSQLLNMSFYPLLSRLYASNLNEFSRVLRIFRVMSALIGLGVGVGAFVLARPIIHAIYTSGYEESVDCFRLLSVAVALSYLDGPLTFAMMATRYEGRAFVKACVTAIATVVLGLVLIPRFGLMGAAIASLISAGMGLLVTVYYFHASLSATLARAKLTAPASSAGA